MIIKSLNTSTFLNYFFLLEDSLKYISSNDHLKGSEVISKALKSILETEEILDEINPYLKRAKEIAGDAAHKTSDFVKTYPGYTVLGAAAIGFLTAAYIFRHRNHN
jgi:ElaB/YqjD/DUF883 family membrane-anchored ribosome-binding protein